MAHPPDAANAGAAGASRAPLSPARLVDWLANAGGLLAGVCIAGIVFSVMTEVVLRYGFNSPTVWSLEVTEYLVIMGAFFGAAYVLKEGRHVVIDVLVGRLTPSTRLLLEITTFAGMLAYAGVLLWYGQGIVSDLFARGTVSQTPLHVPMWIPKSSVPIGGALLVLQLVKQGWMKAAALRQGEAGSPPLSRFSLQNPLLLLPLFVGAVLAAAFLLRQNAPLGMVLLLFTLMLGGMPVAFSLGLTASVMLLVLYPERAGLLQAPLVAYQALESFTLAALPVFIFGASVLARGKLGEQLYEVATKFFGHLPGGLAIATVVAGAVFGAICGSSVASAATFGMIAIPTMLNRGYNKRLVYGVVAISGTLASMIPPSLGMILYGAVSEVSVGKLFMAGIVPGIFETVAICLLVLYMCRGGRLHNPYPRATWKERAVACKNGVWALLAPVVILGGIYLGIFTPTEAAAGAVIYALLVTLLILRTVGWKEMQQIFSDSVKTSGMLLFIIVGAIMLGHLFTFLRIPVAFMNAVQGLNPWTVMILINVLVILLGCILEGASIILVVVPIVYPALKQLGFDPVYFGIVLTANLEIAMLTPPVGMNLFVIQGITRDRMSEVIAGAMPFVFLQAFNLAIIIAFPALSLWLPGTMKW